MSAQKRLRFYVKNWECPLPEDRGILLKDILELSESVVEKEKAYCLCTDHVGTTRDYFKKHQSQIVFEPVRIGDIGSNSQAHRVYSCYGKSVNLVANGGGQGAKTGLYFDDSYLRKINIGTNSNPKIVSAIKEMLEIED